MHLHIINSFIFEPAEIQVHLKTKEYCESNQAIANFNFVSESAAIPIHSKTIGKL